MSWPRGRPGRWTRSGTLLGWRRASRRARLLTGTCRWTHATVLASLDFACAPAILPRKFNATHVSSCNLLIYATARRLREQKELGKSGRNGESTPSKSSLCDLTEATHYYCPQDCSSSSNDDGGQVMTEEAFKAPLFSSTVGKIAPSVGRFVCRRALQPLTQSPTLCRSV